MNENTQPKFMPHDDASSQQNSKKRSRKAYTKKSKKT